MKDLGNIAEDSTVFFLWPTFLKEGDSATRSTDGTIKVLRSDATIITAGITDIEDSPLTGIHKCVIDTSAHADYKPRYDYEVYVETMTVDSAVINYPLANFSIENRLIGIAGSNRV